jgi:hypothetical protein
MDGGLKHCQRASEIRFVSLSLIHTIRIGFREFFSTGSGSMLDWRGDVVAQP